MQQLRRYDSETVKRVLARAAELEQVEAEALSAEQVEALGQELGLRSDLVRRALGEVTGQPVSSFAYRRQVTRSTEITLHAILTACLPGLIYGLLTFPFCYAGARHGWNGSPNLAYLVIFILPVLIAFGAGIRHRDWRKGMIGGVLTVAITIVGAVVATATANGFLSRLLPEDVVVILSSLAAGGILGSAGGAVGRFLSRVAVESKSVAER